LTYTTKARPRRKLSAALGLATATALIALPSSAFAGGSGGIDTTGSDAPEAGTRAKLVNGQAIPPADAPPEVVAAIDAANRIVKGKGYCMGGGHQKWNSSCYDCSGTVSYALGDKGAGLLKAPMPSGSFRSWGQRGKGTWITTYSNPGHMFAVIAGLRLDTSATPGEGPGWSTNVKAGLANGPFTKRHPAGF
jgi:hypothetical protein